MAIDAAKLRALAADWRLKSARSRRLADEAITLGTRSVLDSEADALADCANQIEALLSDNEEAG